MKLTRLSLFARLDDLIAPPPPAPARVAFLRAQPFAHRGLHGGVVVENSLSAFAAAIDTGHGIECDVQMSHDRIPFVFHDDTLDRLTEERGLLADRTAGLLDGVMLRGTSEALPRLDAALTLIAGRVPLLIEIKATHRNIGPVCLGVRRALEGYGGKVAVMSFNPLISHWFARQAPHVVRGLVVTEQGKQSLRGTVERTAGLWKARPDFLAYDIRDLPSRFAARARARGVPVLTWTVRTAEQEAVALVHADEIIYEMPQG